MAQVYDPDIPSSQNPAYAEKTRTLMAKREAQIFGKGKEFATHDDVGWLSSISQNAETDSKPQKLAADKE